MLFSIFLMQNMQKLRCESYLQKSSHCHKCRLPNMPICHLALKFSTVENFRFLDIGNSNVDESEMVY